MMNAPDEDPIMTEIRKHADLIRYLIAGFDCHGPDAFSKGQLFAVLDEMKGQAEAILRLTGVAALDAHFEDEWGRLALDRDVVLGNGSDAPYRAYSEIDG